MPSLAFSAYHELGDADEISPGDLVEKAGNSLPHFRVIAVNDDRAWIRDVKHGTDHLVPASEYRKIWADPDHATSLDLD